MAAGSTFASLVRKYRHERGLTLEQLASRVRKKNGRPVSAAYISLLENGRKPPPSEPIIRALERALRTPSETLAEARDGRLQIAVMDLLMQDPRGRRIVPKIKKVNLSEQLSEAIRHVNAKLMNAKLPRNPTKLPGRVRFKVILDSDGRIEELYALEDLSGA